MTLSSLWTRELRSQRASKTSLMLHCMWLGRCNLRGTGCHCVPSDEGGVPRLLPFVQIKRICKPEVSASLLLRGQTVRAEPTEGEARGKMEDC